VTAPVKSVALNAMFLAPGDSGGPETYLRELVRALADEYPDLRMSVLTTGAGAGALTADGFGELAEVRALPAEEYRRLRRQFAEQVLVQVHARRLGADLLHSLASTGPVRTPGLRSVVTLHDVTFMHTPTFGRVTTWGMTQVVRRAAHDADSLIAVSEAARDEICESLGIDPQRFTVVPHGVGAVPRAEPAPEEQVRARLELGSDTGRIVFCVAAVRPHKNQELLIRALPSLPDDVTLVLAGRHEPYAEQLRELAAQLGMTERVRLTGYLSDGELERLWQMAACAAFPTHAEGFGMPVLEAMARGVPVACSDIAVLREVGGDVPRYFDAADPTSAAAVIGAMLEDAALGQRGVERAARFSWPEAARGTMDAYERALVASRNSLPEA
jgi:glycosyltransferase involved in cell wall biosynthesis